MKKRNALLIVVLLLITSCSRELVIEEPSKPSEINTFNETIENDHIKIDSKMYPIDEKIVEFFEYKNNSDLLERKVVSYNDDERTSDYVRSYEYSEGLLVKETFDQKEETTYRYDEENRTIERKFFIRNELMNEYKYEYSDGTKTLLTYRPDGELLRKLFSYYDENQQLIKTEIYNSDDVLIQRTNITYENEYIRKSISKKNDKVIKESYEEKNNMGDVIKFASIIYLDENDPSTMFYLVDNTYDDNMRLIEKTQYKVMNQIDAEILENNYFK